jgi:hypothetical protein
MRRGLQPPSKKVHVIRGRRIRIRRQRLRKEWGYADLDAKILGIHHTLRGYDLLEILFHEALHLGQWDLDEEAIKDLAPDLASLVWKYREEIFDETEE